MPLTVSPDAAHVMRREIAKAGGREVCFLAGVSESGELVQPRAVARGNHQAVLVAARDANAGEVMVHNHPSGVLDPSEADLSVAARLYEMGLGTAIVDNGVQGLYVVVEPPKPRERIPLDPDALAALLGPGGPLERAHGAYEDRPEQRDVLRVIADRYNEGGVAVVEAGTGTGKSLAYLLPAARWAIDNQERTVVSTNTINLQEQLVSKDLPLVQRLLGEEVRWALVKGRGNYVSIRRLRLAAGSLLSVFEADRSDELDRLLEWVEKTEDGSLSDLAFAPSGEVWEEVQSDADVCLRARCKFFQQCFYQRARRGAASAELLVVNHHLLFSDLSVRRSTGDFRTAAVLPGYVHLVLDEAHNVEDAATTHMGVEVTRRALFRLLSRLDRKGKGVLRALADELGGSDAADGVRTFVEDTVSPAVARARASLTRLVDALDAVLPPGHVEPLRLGVPPLDEPIEHVAVAEALDAALPAMNGLARVLDSLVRRVEEREELFALVEGRLLDLRSAERRARSASDAIRLVLDPDVSGAANVRWIERRGRAPRLNLALAAAPVELGSQLREGLFSRIQSASLLSATLATKQTFDFIRGRVGLDAGGPGQDADAPGHAGAPGHASAGLLHDEGEWSRELEDDGPPLQVVERLVPSPFDYERQTLLCVPTDLPAPGAEGFHQATAEIAQSLAARTDGGLFVLFTSHRSLVRVAALLRDAGVEGRWPLFVQGEEQRTPLLRRFEAAGNGLLLGTSSFWEGVDVPGDPLRGLILEKLPFRVPTEPITAARVESVEARGGNSFWDYMLPLAALRLKQGFGRLVRSRTDGGAVVLLDSRILTRRYGRYLRESLPPTPLVKGPWWEIERRLRDFYADLSGSSHEVD